MSRIKNQEARADHINKDVMVEEEIDVINKNSHIPLPNKRDNIWRLKIVLNSYSKSESMNIASSNTKLPVANIGQRVGIRISEVDPGKTDSQI